MSGIRVLSVVFGERLEIQFVDEDLNTPEVIDVRNRVITGDLFREDTEVILDKLVDLLDKADLHRRNPVQEFRRVSTPPRAVDAQEEG